MVAARQQNLVSTQQLRAAGLSRGGIARRVRNGRLHPQHRGVYAVGTPLLPPLGRERAALLAVPEAVLGFGTAAAVWAVLPAHPSGPVELLSTTQRRSRPGIVVHHAIDLPAADVRTHRGLALASRARVVLDLAPRLGPEALERLVAEVVAAEPGAAGELRRRATKAVRALLDDGPRRTRSANERRLLALVRRAGLPVPRTNVRLHGVEVDAWWPEHGLAVEVDDYATHGDRRSFERDRHRDALLAAHGIATLRITGRRLQDEPYATTAVLAQALMRAAAAPGGRAAGRGA